MDKNKTTLFLDMDDVVADWMGEAQRFLNTTWKQSERNKPAEAFIPAETWQKLRDHHRFYRDLPLMPNAHDLVGWARVFSKEHDLNLAFLTAIPRTNDMPYVYVDKIRWGDRYFPEIPIFFGPYAVDKHHHCRPGDILIDDKGDNCAEWHAAGGIAHQYTTWQNCQEWIEVTLPFYL